MFGTTLLSAYIQRYSKTLDRLTAMPPLVLPLSLVLLVLVFCSSPIVLGAADEHEYTTLVAMSSLKPKATCSGYRGK